MQFTFFPAEVSVNFVFYQWAMWSSWKSSLQHNLNVTFTSCPGLKVKSNFNETNDLLGFGCAQKRKISSGLTSAIYNAEVFTFLQRKLYLRKKKMCSEVFH